LIVMLLMVHFFLYLKIIFFKKEKRMDLVGLGLAAGSDSIHNNAIFPMRLGNWSHLTRLVRLRNP